MNTTSPGAFARALQRQRHKRGRRRLLVAVIAATAVIVGGVGAWLFYFSSVFAAEDVRVAGNELAGTEEIIKTAAVPIGKPLLRIDTAAISDRLQQLPPVAEAKVERSFPNSVKIGVTERTALYQREHGSKFDWVDAGGVVFHSTGKKTPDVPVAVVEGDPETLLPDVATVVANLPEEVLGQLELVRATGLDSIQLELDSDRVVLWGSAEQSELKAEVLSALLELDAKTYDVSAPSHPTTK